MDLKEECILGEHIGEHWYYRAKAAALRRILASLKFNRILDVGAGSGFFSRELLRQTSAWEAICIDPSYPRDWTEQLGDKVILFRRATDAVAADLILLMDVLEHVDDDLGLLRDYVEKVPAGAQVLITVPAFSFLWSSHDLFLEHKRRYTLGQIETVAEQAGLTVEQGCYFFGALFPLAAGMRLTARLRSNQQEVRSDLKRHSPLVNTLLHTACRLELPFMPFNRAFGLSAFCLAKKG